MARPVVSSTTPSTPIVQNGQTSFAWLKWFQNIAQAINAAFDQAGAFIGNLGAGASIDPAVTITGRTGSIGAALGNIDSGGVILGPGIDFTRPYLNKTTDNIADGTGSPLAGGKTAFAALIASTPGFSLVYSGTQWGPAQVQYSNIAGRPTLPSDAPATASKWVKSYTAATGAFTETQPAFTDISGTATAAQIPALSALSGAITASQLPANVPVISFGSGAPSGSSNEGYIYFDTSVTPYQGYVFHSAAWNKFS